jgi:hypothetical protein
MIVLGKGILPIKKGRGCLPLPFFCILIVSEISLKLL